MSNSHQNLWPQTSFNNIPKLNLFSARQFEVPKSSGHIPTQSSISNIGGSDAIDVAFAIKQIALQSKTILTIDEAAELLHCAVSTLQTMPIDELPTYEGVGRYTLYLKSDLEAYVRSRRRVEKRGTGLVSCKPTIDIKPVKGSINPARQALDKLQ